MKPVAILGFCVLGLLAQASYAVKIYMWTDAQGTTHYGEHPPKDVKATLIDARTGHSAPPPSEMGGDEKAANTADSNLSPRVKDKEACDMARKNLDTLTKSPRVKIPQTDGSLRYMTPEEIQQKTTEMKKIADENCE